MNAVKPGLKAHIVDLAKNQPQYSVLPVAMVCHPGYAPVRLKITDERSVLFNTMVSCWQPTPEERAQLAAGECVYIGLLTGAERPQPMNVVVGPKAAGELYGVQNTRDFIRPPRILVNRCEKCPTAAICEGRDLTWRCAQCGRQLKTEGPLL